MAGIKCPFCGFLSSENTYRRLREPWRFRLYDVRMLECLRFRVVFNYYEGISLRNEYPVFTIGIKPRRKRQIMNTLYSHPTACQLREAERLGVH